MENIFWQLVSVISGKAFPASFGFSGASDFEMVEREVRAASPKSVAPYSSVYGTDPFSAARAVIRRCDSDGINIVPLTSNEYPKLLMEISRPPRILFVKGEIPERRNIAIVGTRRSDEESESAALLIASSLASSGICVVSGIAGGIDRFAHLGAMQEGGATVAVVAGGIDNRYPSSNADIFASINNSPCSAIVAEYPPGIHSDKWAFARRNRIISGMSEKVVLVKAPAKSGALITAKYCVEQNRDLLVCPWGSFRDDCAGSNALIRQGASVISSISDLEDEIGMLFSSPKIQTGHAFPMDEDESEIYSMIKNGEREVDSIIRLSGKTAGDIARIIISLEISGLVKRTGSLLHLL